MCRGLKKRPPILAAQLENLSVQIADVRLSGGAQHDDKACEVLTEVRSRSKRVKPEIASSSESEAKMLAISSFHRASEGLTIGKLGRSEKQ